MYQLGEWGGGRDGRRVRGRKHCICSLCGVWRLAASGTDPSAVRRPASCMHQWSPAQHEKGQLPLETRWQNDVFAAVYTEPASGSLSLCADIHRRASTFNLTKCQTLCCFTFRRLPCWEEGEHVLLLQLHGGSVVVFIFFFSSGGDSTLLQGMWGLKNHAVVVVALLHPQSFRSGFICHQASTEAPSGNLAE